MTNLNALLYDFLVEESGMPVGEFRILTEDMKSETIIEIANEVLHSIQKRLSTIDTVFIDKTRGEIKNLSELQTIQDVLNKLTNLAYSNQDNLPPLVPLYLKEITKAIYNLNKYAPQFKEAYRSKKTFLILNYQSVILSIISSLSYIVSAVIDFKDVNVLKFKQNANIVEILSYKSLKEFNKSIDNGSFDSALKDFTALREFYSEYSVEDMLTICESVDIAPLLNKGIEAFSDFFNNSHRNGIIFKVLGIVMIILSLRDVFYSLSNSRIKISDKIQNLKSFLNIDNLPSISAVSRFITFNNKNAAESVYASDSAKNEIEQENKEIITTVKTKPIEPEVKINDFVPHEVESSDNKQADPNDIFAGFNF